MSMRGNITAFGMMYSIVQEVRIISLYTNKWVSTYLPMYNIQMHVHFMYLPICLSITRMDELESCQFEESPVK